VILLAVLSAGWTIFPPPADWVETWYSRWLFPRLAAVLVPVVDFFPFSASIFLLAGMVVVSVWEFAATLRRGRKEDPPPWRRVVAGWIQAGLCACVLAYACFLLLWGAGYRRVRLEERLALQEEKGSPTANPAGPESPRVGPADLSRWTNALSRLVEREVGAERSEERAIESVRESMSALLDEWQGFSPPLPRRIKRLPAGTLLAFGFSGVTTLILEPHVDAAEPGPAFLSVAAHELAHCAGFCAEADADLVAAVAGLRASDAHARYSTALHLFRHFTSHLDRAERAKAFDSLPDPARRDMSEMDAVAARYRVAPLANVQTRIYESYLRSQGLQHGMKEYSFIVRLLVAAERKGIVKLPGEE
jgi:hypothetical protein